ncbi:MAG: hypothetical protein GX050_06985 [Firmicutes bacterium]|nr:hypothetical protein [Bacillota bacterium]
MRKELRVVLPLILICLLVGTILAANDTASHEITVTIPEYVNIEILNGDIDVNFADFGQTVTAGPVGVKYRCNKSGNWALTVSATDFIGEAATQSFSVSHLKWGLTSGSITNSMPLTGEDAAQVATWNTPVNQTTEIYYLINYPEEAFAGSYSTTVTYSIVAL